jgi:hypothetical protein
MYLYISKDHFDVKLITKTFQSRFFFYYRLCTIDYQLIAISTSYSNWAWIWLIETHAPPAEYGARLVWFIHNMLRTIWQTRRACARVDVCYDYGARGTRISLISDSLFTWDEIEWPFRLTVANGGFRLHYMKVKFTKGRLSVFECYHWNQSY